MTQTTAHPNAEPDAIAQRLYDELHAPDGRVPTLDDYTPILRELRLLDAQKLTPKPTTLAPVGLPPSLPMKPVQTFSQFKIARELGLKHPFLHHDRNAGRWIVSAEYYPLEGFVMMVAPDGQRGYVFRDFIEAAKSLGAVETRSWH